MCVFSITIKVVSRSHARLLKEDEGENSSLKASLQQSESIAPILTALNNAETVRHSTNK